MSGIEIERKYRLSTLPPRELLGRGEHIAQGYIEAGDPEIRLRQKEQRFFLTIKTGEGLQREEHEIEITRRTFERLWPLTEGARIVKTRYTMASGVLTWEIDEYAGSLEGLYVAEVELPSASTTVEIPPVLGLVKEVTDDPGFKNKALATRGLPPEST